MSSRIGLPFRLRAPLNRLKKQCETRETDILSLSLSSKIYKYLKPTPLQKARCMSKNKNVFLKREDLNPTFSFYVRCAINQLINEETKKNVVASSIGSRGYCLAYASSLFDKKCTVFMQENVPSERIEMVKSMGAEVLKVGKNTNECTSLMKKYSMENDVSILGSHDNKNVLAGCGTISLELFKENLSIDAIFVPVGGGSLVSGICYNIKTMFPNIKIYGVEYKDQSTLHDSLMCGYLVEKDDPGVYGLSVSKISKTVFDICDRFLDDIVLVDRVDIENAIIDCFKDTRTVIEPHGVLSIAGMEKIDLNGKNIVCILSDSGNINGFENVSSMYKF